MIQGRIQLTVAGIFRGHLAVIAILLCAHLAFKLIYFTTGHGGLYGLAPIFDLANEDSIPNFVSAIALLVAAFVAFLITCALPTRQGALAYGWTLSTVILLYLAFDEGIGLHDRLSVPLQGAMNSHGLLYIGWVAPYIVLILICALLLVPFIRVLPRPVLVRLVVAGVVYIGSAMGLEMVEGLLMEWSVHGASLAQVDQDAINRTLPMVALVTVEETGEMLGAALALRALLYYLRDDCAVRGVELLGERRATAGAAPDHPAVHAPVAR